MVFRKLFRPSVDPFNLKSQPNRPLISSNPNQIEQNSADLLSIGSLPHPTSHIHQQKRRQHQPAADSVTWGLPGFAVHTAIGTLRPTGRRPAVSRIYGAEGSRTPDLCSAIAALSQLSYSPAIGARLPSLSSGRTPALTTRPRSRGAGPSARKLPVPGRKSTNPTQDEPESST